jgi:hypothetical protein
LESGEERLRKKLRFDYIGDVVVSKPTGGFGGVVQYDFGKAVGQGVFERTGSLNKPPQILLTAIAKMEADQMVKGSRVPEDLSEMVATHPKMEVKFTYRGHGHEQDRLFDAYTTTMDQRMLAILVKPVD